MFPKRVTLLTMLSFEEWTNFAQIKRTPKLFFHIPFLLWESLYNVSLILRQTLVGICIPVPYVHYEPSALLLAHFQGSWGRREDVPAGKSKVSQKSPLCLPVICKHGRSVNVFTMRWKGVQTKSLPVLRVLLFFCHKSLK